MRLLLNKLLPLIVLPLGGSLGLLIWAAVRRRRVALWAALSILLISSNPLVGHFLIRCTERWAERKTAPEAPSADAIVVLSAGRVLAPGPARISEWQDANRFFGGVELMRAGKAPLLVFTGGALPWDPRAPLEGDVLARFAESQGIPRNQIAVTARVSNTADEALEVGRLLRSRQTATPRVLLVTAAFHLPRAEQLFEAQGMQVSPFPVGFMFSAERRFSLLDLFPSVSALGQTETAVREFYGRLYYRIF